MGGNLRVALGIIMLVCGMAILGAAVYLHYVALPEEHTPKHVTKRAALGIGGLVLVLGGSNQFS